MGEHEIVSVAQGRLQGRRNGNVIAFLGVPYAAPPFGASRLRPPAPPPPDTRSKPTSKAT